MLFEFHNYHYDPSKFNAYRQWAQEEAVPFLKANLDIVGCWFDIGKTLEYWGTDMTPSQHGPANAIWIVRWESLEQRTREHNAVYESEG